MFKILLKNNKTFFCSKDKSILESAQNSKINLEYSCLKARCRSCMVKVLEGKVKDINEDIILSKDEKNKGYILTCNTIPLTDIKLETEDLNEISIQEQKVIPAKIDLIKIFNENYLELSLRIPPNIKFEFNPGQYVNIIKNDIERSYSISNNFKNKKLIFLIKKYQNGVLSDYFFHSAKHGDLLRIKGPIGTFSFRKSEKQNIIFIATGTGIAPVKSILDNLAENLDLIKGKKIWLFWGMRFKEYFFWKPNYNKIELKYIPVVSRNDNDWKGATGYVQEKFIDLDINLLNAQVYACGSSKMIESLKQNLMNKSFEMQNFYSDTFLNTNN